MSQENKRNLQFFEAGSMRELYDCLDAWQVAQQKRFLSISVHCDRDKFCCIALTNPSEVVITAADGMSRADVSSGCLYVRMG